LHELQRATPCSALRLYNHSFDGVVAALSPFPLLHPSPVGPGGGQPFSVASFRTIRPERELAVALAADAPLVVTHVAGQLALPATFERWRAFPMPPAPWFSDGSGRMQLMVTRRCLPPA
jgi:hypothetical protein